MRKRALKSSRKKKTETSDANSKRDLLVFAAICCVG
jgi:hypothetical protein